MCTIILLQNQFKNYPLIIAANRDELYSRPALGPRILDKQNQIIGAQDQVSKGTWLAYSKKTQTIAAITNESDSYDKSLRSRGHLVLSSLKDDFELKNHHEYNKFNLIVANQELIELYLGHDKFSEIVFGSGIHIITNNYLSNKDKQDFLYERISRIVDKYSEPNFEYLKNDLINILSLHDHRICIHDPDYGTRSSTIMAIGETLEYHHSDEPPCEAKFRNFNYLMEG